MNTKHISLLMMFSLPCCGITSSSAQTLLSGVISSSTTLTLAESPYLVTGNLLVAENVQLTVEPGVLVRFQAVQLLLRGPLVAHGNATDPIVFEGVDNDIDGWEGIRIDNYANAKVDLAYFHGRYAHKLFQDDRAIGTDTVIKVVHSTLESNTFVLRVSDPYGNTRRYFDHCIMTNNEINCSVAPGSTFKNTVFSNGITGVRNYYNPSSLTVVDSCTFINLSYIAVGEGVQVTNSVFRDNSDHAISLDHYTRVHGCTIFNNSRGLFVGMASVNMANSVTQNTICNNEKNVELMYGADFYAPDNCWCLDDSAAIRQTMLDFFSTADLGIVHYAPFNTNCGLPTQVEANEQDSQGLLLYPNPNTGLFTVAFPYPLKADSYYSVYDILGKLLYQRPLPIGATFEKVDLSLYGRGSYLIKFTSPEHVVHVRMLLE